MEPVEGYEQGEDQNRRVRIVDEMVRNPLCFCFVYW
jgi:hypothetical protein